MAPRLYDLRTIRFEVPRRVVPRRGATLPGSLETPPESSPAAFV
jgi:hypothetical protein